jgi:hypothetical protein
MSPVCGGGKLFFAPANSLSEEKKVNNYAAPEKRRTEQV